MIFVKHVDEILKRKKKLPEEENYQMTFPASLSHFPQVFSIFFVEILLGHVFWTDMFDRASLEAL